MRVYPIKTRIFLPKQQVFDLVIEYLPKVAEYTVLVVASKLFSYQENRLLPVPSDPLEARLRKYELVRQEADWYLPPNEIFSFIVTMKNNVLAVNAGIDQSNSIDGSFLLWPNNFQALTDQLWQQLRDFYRIKNLGLIVADSRTIPLRWGVIGTAICSSGLKHLRNYIGTTDIFGRLLKMSQTNIVESLAVTASMLMGEGSEQQPLAVIDQLVPKDLTTKEKAKLLPVIEFLDQPQTTQQLQELKISLEEDVYSTFLKNAGWQKGGGGCLT